MSEDEYVSLQNTLETICTQNSVLEKILAATEASRNSLLTECSQLRQTVIRQQKILKTLHHIQHA
jgi:hypothetical protein